MQSTTIHIKTDVKTRNDAKKVAAEFGFTLSALVNALLKQIGRTKRLNLSMDESPTPFMIDAMRTSEEDVKAGRVRSFEKPEDAITYVSSLVHHEKH